MRKKKDMADIEGENIYKVYLPSYEGDEMQFIYGFDDPVKFVADLSQYKPELVGGLTFGDFAFAEVWKNGEKISLLSPVKSGTSLLKVLQGN